MMEHDEWDQPHHPQQASTAANPASFAKRLRRTFIQHWRPKALDKPQVDHDLHRLSGIERAAEVLRFMLHRLEYWISPLGHLREFVKLNFRLAIAIAIPVMMVAPLVTMALDQFKAWINLLTQTMSSFVLFPLSVVLSILLVCGMVYIGRSILEMRMRSGRRDPYGY